MQHTQTTPQIFTPAAVPGSATLPELQQLKSAWLEQARQAGHFEACRVVVEQLGRRIEHERHYPYNYHPAWAWASRDLFIVMWYQSRVYIPQVCEYEETYKLFVTLGEPFLIPGGSPAGFDLIGQGRTVAQYTWSNIPGHSPHNGLFVPGQWLERVLYALPEAEQVIERRNNAGREAARLALAESLLIGQEI